MAPLRAGFAREDITPDLGTLLFGYPVAGRAAEAIRDRLAANALVLEQGDTRAVLLSLDVCVVDDQGVAAIREAVQARTGIAEQHITVCATHTHSAPCTIDMWGWSERNLPYIQLLVERSAAACTAAAAAVRPVRLGIGAADSQVGVNRREVTEDHQVKLGVNPWGAFDPTLTVLRFAADDGEVVSVIHYGAHPTVLSGQSRAVSRDWPGVMIDRVEALTGAPAMFVNGAAGDVAPRMSMLGAVGDGAMALMETGGRAAMDAMGAHRSVKRWDAAPELRVMTAALQLPYRPLPELELARQEMAAAEPARDEPGRGAAEYHYWRSVIDAHGGAAQQAKTYEQTVTALGPVALVPVPGEPFAEIGLRLRQLSPLQHTLCASTGNGSCGYFVTRESLHRGGYEVWVARAFGADIFAENIDDVLVQENLRLLRELAGHPSLG